MSKNEYSKIFIPIYAGKVHLQIVGERIFICFSSAMRVNNVSIGIGIQSLSNCFMVEETSHKGFTGR